jgi:hypothetical protein
MVEVCLLRAVRHVIDREQSRLFHALLGGFLLAAPTLSTAALTPSQPIVISGQSNVTISGVSISNPSGPCITVKNGSQNIVIRDSELGPCAGSGVLFHTSNGVTLTNSYVHDTTEEGVTAFNVDGLTIIRNRMARNKTGVHAAHSTRVNVQYNNFLNVTGPFPRGQFVQFEDVSGTGNRIKCNYGLNQLGQSYPEDAINLYRSYGDPTDPIQIIGNKINGGGPSFSGGGIMLGDAGGSYQIAQDNILVDPGQYGVSVAGGNNITVSGNMIYARQQPFTNVGITVWMQRAPDCYAITVQGNSTNWTNANGARNGKWTGGNCGTISGWDSNNWDAAIDANIITSSILGCAIGEPSR